MQYQLCRHIRTNGLQCKSPALSERDYCFFHDRLYRRHSPYRHTQATQGYLLPGRDLELTALEDPESVQLALSLVINALATGQLETRRATALLYGLQTASNNAARLRAATFNPDIVRTTETTPDGLDLALPGAIYDPPTITFDDPDDEDDAEEETGECPQPHNHEPQAQPGFPDLDTCQAQPQPPPPQGQTAFSANRKREPRIVPWEGLHGQMGAEYAELRQFRAKVLLALKKIQLVYPTLKLETTTSALIVHPSPTAIAAKS